ncbi:ABC transporter permease [Corynebacterium glyciniphilum]|uniref:ABC transporter permease n=1 Tax=Corynebacterium glyciniphilum TaxID=1404244 RepID=UPI0011AB2EF5|nr:ABC transporter permease [Corynebacterium glyciniphilum]
MWTTVVNEFAKMRHLRVGTIAAVMVITVLGLAMVGLLSDPAFDPDTTTAWNSLLAGMSLGTPLVAPLLLAVLASRQTDIEHRGNGWLLQTTAGLAPGAVCRAKFLSLGSIVTAITAVVSLGAAAAGRVLVGISSPLPVGHWIGFTVCILLVNLVLLALHILLAAKVENQLIGLGLAVLGTLLGLFSRNVPDVLAHFTPWGYYALAEAANFQDGVMVTVPIPYAGFVGLAVVATAAFILLTSRLDRQEA